MIKKLVKYKERKRHRDQKEGSTAHKKQRKQTRRHQEQHGARKRA